MYEQKLANVFFAQEPKNWTARCQVGRTWEDGSYSMFCIATKRKGHDRGKRKRIETAIER